jgi:hypothetical protein
MPDISNHELDKLFQEAAAGIKPKFDPADWERLAQRLDQEDTTSFARTISLYSIAALMGLISIFPGQETSFASTAEQVRKDSYERARSEELEARSEKPVPGHFRGGVRRDGSEVTTQSERTRLEESVRKDAQEEVSSKDGGVSEVTAGGETGKDSYGKAERAESKEPSFMDATTEEPGAGSQKPEVRRQSEGAPKKSSPTQTSSRKISADKPANKQEAMSGSVNSELSSTDSVNALAPAERSGDTRMILVKKDEKKSKNAHEKETTSGTVSFDQVSSDTSAGKPEGDSVASKVSTSGELKRPGSIKSESRPAGSRLSQTDSVKVSPSTQRASGSGAILLETKEESKEEKSGSRSERTPLEELSQEGSFGKTRDQQSFDNADSIRAANLKQNRKHAVVTGDAASVSPQADSIKILKPVQPVSDSTAVVAAAEEEEKEKEKTEGSKWFLKLPVSPDFTSISYYKPGKTGLNIGLLVEFIPGKHLAFSTGAIWSRKLYSTDNPGTSYTSGPYTSKVSFLDGDCRVLDIPVNITYYLPLRTRTTFFATAGLSSYIMLKEKYTYTVTANNHDYYYSEDYTRKNNEWFSMLNLSIGIQRQIGERFWLQAEPFLKAPLSGIGEGKVDLVSMGAFFTIKYQLKK